MEERENRKGPGVFYAVIGVATLVVAIIGATFAYFSVTATDNETITGDTADAAGLTLEVNAVGNTSSNLIPLNLISADGATGLDAVDQFADALGTAKGDQCKDSNGNNVCQIYKIDLTNNSSSTAIQVRGTLNLASPNTQNMYWQLLANATSTTRAGYATDVQQGNSGNITVGGNKPTEPVANDKAAASHTLAAGATGTYYVVVWLEETGSAQEAADAKVAETETTEAKDTTWTGTVTFNAVDNQGATRSGVTATFNS